jgi:aminoglycoside phosphotransferase (APT) family kinase protein
VLDRRPNLQGSFPHEVVTCRLGDGSARQLFCKYGVGHTESGFGHRGGVPYEAEVYRRVLRPSGLSAPAFLGSCTNPATGEVWMVLEYLDGSLRVGKAPDPAAMGLAARWAGQFHAAQETSLTRGDLAFLNRYDAGYYRGWAQRTARFAGPRHEQYPWLSALCGRFEQEAAALLAPTPTVIHGEYYPKNVLWHRGAIYPVDWESAAVASGLIDLASLTEKWPADVAQRCAAEYGQARWPGGTPADFERTLDAARVYLHLRWLGNRPDWTSDEGRTWRFEELHLLGERLGLV